MSNDLNLFYKPLEPCDKILDTSCTYFYSESGINIVCIEFTNDIYNFFRRRGLDLTKTNVGIKEGDKCCICVYKWVEAYHAGVAPKIIANSTSIELLKHIPIEILKNYII